MIKIKPLIRKSMSHLEFIGPPGVGKSTIHASLIEDVDYFGGVDENAILRSISGSFNSKFIRLYNYLPMIIRQKVEESVEYRVRHNAFEQFLDKNITALNVIANSINCVSHEKQKMLSSFKNDIENYQIGHNTVQENEILCLDQAFALRAFGLIWRSDSSFELNEYYDTFPKPSSLVYVDAPIDVCVTRQIKRNNLTVERDWIEQDLYETQKELKQICDRIVNYLEPHTDIVRIDGRKPVSVSVRKIKNSTTNKIDTNT